MTRKQPSFCDASMAVNKARHHHASTLATNHHDHGPSRNPDQTESGQDAWKPKAIAISPSSQVRIDCGLRAFGNPARLQAGAK
jgi:N-acetylmuramoyl-L-alanine amidase